MSTTKSLINKLSVDPSKEPIFFGKPLGMQRYDLIKNQALWSYTSKQISFLWRPEEISIGKDAADFKSLTEQQQWIFTKNLGYQILLDSIQSRGIGHLLEYCSNTEVESFCKWWETFETLHSYSYTYIIQNVYNDPTGVLNDIMQDDAILDRATAVTQYYDDMINTFDQSDDIHEKKKALYLTLVSINILEGLRFYVSFACSYYFAEQDKMLGNANIIKLINRDENLHLGFTKTLLNQLRKPEEGFTEVIDECKYIVEQMWRDAVNEEIAWAEYLFKDGDLIGLNADILSQYMHYLANVRMKVCGFEQIFPKTRNPITWIDKYISSKHVQNAPQEQENTNYLTNSMSTSSGEDLNNLWDD